MANLFSLTQTSITALQDLLFAIAAGSVLCGAILHNMFLSSRNTARLRLRGSIKQAMPGTNLPRVRWLALSALGILHLVCLWLQAVKISGSTFFHAFGVLGTVLAQSHYGHVWLVGFAGIAIALIPARRAMRETNTRSNPTAASMRPNRSPLLFTVIGLALYAAGQVGASHAAHAGHFSLAQSIHWVHFGATASWAGSLFAATAVLPTFACATHADRSRHLVFCERLSRISALALALALVTGLYNALWIDTHIAASLLHTPYDALLGIKLALAALALMLGAMNRIIWLPRLRSTQAMQHNGAPTTGYVTLANNLHRTLLVESMLLAATLVTAVLLAHTPFAS